MFSFGVLGEKRERAAHLDQVRNKGRRDNRASGDDRWSSQLIRSSGHPVSIRNATHTCFFITVYCWGEKIERVKREKNVLDLEIGKIDCLVMMYWIKTGQDEGFLENRHGNTSWSCVGIMTVDFSVYNGLDYINRFLLHTSKLNKC